MISLFVRFARRLTPDFDDWSERERVRLLADIVLTLIGLPLAIAGIAWLAASSDVQIMRTYWPTALVILAAGYTLFRVSFFQVSGVRAGETAFSSTTLTPVLLVSALLLFGPTTLWLFLFLIALEYAPSALRVTAATQRWSLARNLISNIWSVMLSSLLALVVYRWAGGVIPLASLAPRDLWPAILAVLVLIGGALVGLALIFAVQGWLLAAFGLHGDPTLRRRTLRFFLVSEVSAFFGIMAAVLYASEGVGAYAFFLFGVALVSLLARRLSQAAVLGQQRTREVTQLERLGRAIIAAPPDASRLPELLAEYAPQMFSYRHLEIRLFPNQTLLSLPRMQPAVPEALWRWIEEHPEYCDVPTRALQPWSGEPAQDRVVLSPILASDGGRPLGGICLVQEANIYENLAIDLQPATQTLAAQIASTLHSADIYRRDLEHRRVAQELTVAGQIQASFLPSNLPALPGWQLAAALQPARETSGDFYDAFPLPNGKLGLLVADVSDKGMGAALVMALARTLLRTYAYEYHGRPDYVLRVANRRILADTQSGLFVSVFYGVVDPYAGALTFANAGHNPPYLLKNHGSARTDLLRRTGMVLGVMEGVEWQAETVAFGPGDMLVAYSDGFSDALNEADEFFGEERLRAIVEQQRNASARQMVDAVVEAQRRFVGQTPLFDDATLMVLKRD